jgi:lipid-binding SYLF domain-containing protein
MSIYRNLRTVVALLLVLSVPYMAQANSFSNAIDVFKKAPAVQAFFQDAYGYAVFPNIGKGGFVVGVAYGEGLVYRGEEITGTTTVVEGSVGFQFGGQVFSEVVFFQDKRAYDEFTSGTFEFDAAATAVAVTAGAQAQAGTAGATAGASAGPVTAAQAETEYRKGMAIFLQAKGGLMVELAIGGQKFSFAPLDATQ